MEGGAGQRLQVARPAELLLRRRVASLVIQRCVSFAEEMKNQVSQPFRATFIRLGHARFGGKWQGGREAPSLV